MYIHTSLIGNQYSGHDKYSHFPLFIALNNNDFEQIRTSRYTVRDIVFELNYNKMAVKCEIERYYMQMKKTL